MYKAVIFDFFDVIHRDPFHEWLRQSGLERGGELHEASRQLDLGLVTDQEHYETLGKLSGQSAGDVKAVFDDTNFIDSAMVELIKKLKPNYKIALLSNTSTTYIKKVFDQHNLEPLFDVITISADVGLIKPDPSIFEHSLRDLGVRADEAIFIDDNPKNAKSAKTIGLKSLVYKDIDSLKAQLQNLGVKT